MVMFVMMITILLYVDYFVDVLLVYACYSL
jgi:hypothetical protein